MKKNMSRRIISIALCVALVMTLTSVVMADTLERRPSNEEFQQASSDLNELIGNFSFTIYNAYGEKFTVTFDHEAEHDWNDAIAYILRYGVDGFETKINNILNEVCYGSPAYGVTPFFDTGATRTLRVGNGTQTVWMYRAALVNFPQGGAIEYLAWITHSISANGGQLTGRGRPSFIMDHMNHPLNAAYRLDSMGEGFSSAMASSIARYTVQYALWINGVPFRIETMARTFTLHVIP